MVLIPFGATIDPNNIIQSNGVSVSLYTFQQVSPPELPQAKISFVLGESVLIDENKPAILSAQSLKFLTVGEM
jgi:hypothetical protein